MRYKSKTKVHIHDLGVMLGQAGVERQGRREGPPRSPPNTCTWKVCGTAALEACNNSTSAMHGMEGLGKKLQQGKKKCHEVITENKPKKKAFTSKSSVFTPSKKSGMAYFMTVFSCGYQQLWHASKGIHLDEVLGCGCEPGSRQGLLFLCNTNVRPPPLDLYYYKSQLWLTWGLAWGVLVGGRVFLLGSRDTWAAAAHARAQLRRVVWVEAIDWPVGVHIWLATLRMRKGKITILPSLEWVKCM